MTGQPVTRASSADGTWAYTLYTRQRDAPFVHALDTRRREAVCIDLDGWRGTTDALWKMRLVPSADGKTILLRSRTGGTVMAIDAPGG